MVEMLWVTIYVLSLTTIMVLTTGMKMGAVWAFVAGFGCALVTFVVMLVVASLSLNKEHDKIDGREQKRRTPR